MLKCILLIKLITMANFPNHPNYFTPSNVTVWDRNDTVLEKTKKYPLMQLSSTKQGMCHEVPVLNQYYGVDNGKEDCGAHALKNALVGLALAYEVKEVDKKLLCDVNFYREFYQFLMNCNPEIKTKKDKDFSIVHLNHLLLTLMGQSPVTPPAFVPFQKMLSQYPHSISFLNLLKGHSDLTMVISNLSSLANLHTVATTKGPLSHAFVIGISAGTGHWITLILHKDSSDNYHWFGLDSDPWRNPFEEHCNILNTAIFNYYDVILQTYNKFISADIIRRVNLIKENMANHDVSELLQIAGPDLEFELTSLLNFMKRVNWLDNRNDLSITANKNHLLKLTHFGKQQGLSHVKLQHQMLSIDEVEKLLK